MRSVLDYGIVHSLEVERGRLAVPRQNRVVSFECKKFVYNGIFEVFFISVVKVRAPERHKNSVSPTKILLPTT